MERLLRNNNLPYEDINSKVDSLFIAIVNSASIGIGGLEIHDDYGLLRSLVIEESFRGKGYGKALCLRLVEVAKSKGVKEAYLLTTAAKTFFERIGFEEVDRNLIPKEIQHTNEFRDLCPSSAVCMRIEVC